MNTKRLATLALAAVGMAGTLAACGDDAASLPSDTEQLAALLTVSDLDFFPDEWEFEENMRLTIESPVAPWENTLDPYLCTGAGTPEVLTHSQAQLELTGGSVMEIIVADTDAADLYDELVAAYADCDASSSLPYEELTMTDTTGDESMSYRSSLGAVTVARFDTQVMILKWWVGDYWDQVSEYYPQLVAAAAAKVDAL